MILRNVGKIIHLDKIPTNSKTISISMNTLLFFFVEKRL
jgi:hypothetical protein